MRKLIVLLAAVSLAGCVNMAPPHERPALPTAPDYPEAFAGDVTPGQRATDVAWQDFFADPQLEVLIAQAIARNRDLAVAVAQIEEARGLYRIQDADRLPTVGASADAARTRGPSLTGTGTDTTSRYSVGVGVTS
ncbi:MAG: TolC family protein, partial [Sphingopyxis sp.]|nr:TolC family protein [Sphingopyxis sp.]